MKNLYIFYILQSLIFFSKFLLQAPVVNKYYKDLPFFHPNQWNCQGSILKNGNRIFFRFGSLTWPIHIKSLVPTLAENLTMSFYTQSMFYWNLLQLTISMSHVNTSYSSILWLSRPMIEDIPSVATLPFLLVLKF